MSPTRSSKPAARAPRPTPVTGKGPQTPRNRRTVRIVTAVAVTTLALTGAAVLASCKDRSSNVAVDAGSTKSGSANTGSPKAGKFRFAVGDPGPGKPAPPIVLTSSTLGKFDLAAQHGKGVLLYFQEGIGCQPCWDQMRDYATSEARFKAVGVDELVTITVDSPQLLARKMRQDGVTGIVLADLDLAVSKAYHANDYGMMGDSTDGHTFIYVDPTGTIRWRADYGGKPDFTMYVPPDNLLADLRAGLGLPAAG